MRRGLPHLFTEGEIAMNSRMFFALCLSAFLFLGLSGLAQAADRNADQTAADMTVQGASADRLPADDIVVALFEKKEKCYEVWIKYSGKEPRKADTVWAKDCKAANAAAALPTGITEGKCVEKTYQGKEKIKTKDQCY